MKLSKTTDHSHRVVPPSRIVRAFWSKERAWHGDHVKLHVETRYVPDGATVDIEIWEEEPGADAFIEEISGAGVIEKGRCVIDHEIDWSSDSLGKDLTLEGDKFEFYFIAKITDFNLKKKSTWLYVDLDEFQLSR